MSKFYTSLQISRISSTASLSILGDISSGFESIYPKSDGYIYHVTSDFIERKLGHEILLSCGLTYSSILENAVAPYGSILSLNVSGGLTFSNCQLIIGSVTASQISTDNSPSNGNVLGFNGSGLTWTNKVNIDDIAALFGISCGVGYQATPTYSISGGIYNLGIYCEFTGTTTTTTEAPTTTTTTEAATTTTCAPPDITTIVDIESNNITFASSTYGPGTNGTVTDPDGISTIFTSFPIIISPLPPNYDGLTGWAFNIDGDPCSPYNIVVPTATTTTTTEAPTTTTTTTDEVIPGP